MTSFATLHDVEAAWRPLNAAELLVVESRLAFISAIIRSKVVGVDSRITAGTLDPELVKHVAVEAVLRKFRNPDGKSEEQIEDYRYKRDTATAGGQLYLTDDEIALLSRRARRAFSIAPSTEPADYGITERVGVLQQQWAHWPPLGNGTDVC